MTQKAGEMGRNEVSAKNVSSLVES